MGPVLRETMISPCPSPFLPIPLITLYLFFYRRKNNIKNKFRGVIFLSYFFKSRITIVLKKSKKKLKLN